MSVKSESKLLESVMEASKLAGLLYSEPEVIGAVFSGAVYELERELERLLREELKTSIIRNEARAIISLLTLIQHGKYTWVISPAQRREAYEKYGRRF